MNGIVQGGWGYVIAAYIVSTLVLGGYAAHAFVLHRFAKRLDDHIKP